MLERVVFHLQTIFTRYDEDKSGTISSFEMRNAVADAGAGLTHNTHNVHPHQREPSTA